jgi:hypothetical protein
MTQKFYLHDTTTTDTGTLPSAQLSAQLTAAVTATGAATNRAMDGTPGASQVSIAITTLAQTAAQAAWFRRWVSAPIAAQNVLGSVTAVCGGSEANAGSNFSAIWVGYIWRPGTGASVGRLFDAGNAITSSEAGTTETNLTVTGNSALTVTAADGDIIVIELWRNNATQTAATAWANTAFYNGTTDNSTTSNAAFINFSADIALQGSAGPAVDPMGMEGYFGL